MKENRKTTTSGLDWNTFVGLTQQLKKDKLYRDYLLIMCGCYFGLRIGDLIKLKWKDLENREYFVLLESKTKKSRQVIIHAEVAKALDFCQHSMKSEPHHFLFANRWGEPMSTSFVNKRIKYLFNKYRVQAQNPSSHTLRKTFGKRIYEMDGQSERSLIYLSEIFGWKKRSN
jgi:integrase